MDQYRYNKSHTGLRGLIFVRNDNLLGHRPE